MVGVLSLFMTLKDLVIWIGVCGGKESHRRLLTQALSGLEEEQKPEVMDQEAAGLGAFLPHRGAMRAQGQGAHLSYAKDSLSGSSVTSSNPRGPLMESSGSTGALG